MLSTLSFIIIPFFYVLVKSLHDRFTEISFWRTVISESKVYQTKNSCLQNSA